MIWRVFIIAALIAVAALSLFARRDRPDQLPGLGAAAPEAPQPGYFMTEAHIVQTGVDGLPVYRVDAARIQQNPQDMTVRLEELRMDYTPKSGGAELWTLTAKTGVMPQSATQIELQEEVEIRGRPLFGDGRAASTPAVLRTSKLLVDMQTEVAHTREPVDIVWGERHLRAVGLTADFKAGRVKLESAVHGRFVR